MYRLVDKCKLFWLLIRANTNVYYQMLPKLNKDIATYLLYSITSDYKYGKIIILHPNKPLNNLIKK